MSQPPLTDDRTRFLRGLRAGALLAIPVWGLILLAIGVILQ